MAVVKSVGAMQTMEIKNNDGSIRDAAYLEAQLVDPSLQQGQVIKSFVFMSCFVITILNCLRFQFFFFFIPVTFWGPAAADVRRHPAWSAIKLKGVVVVSREGRLTLKATGVTDVETWFKFL